jgi:hypothetical protein
MLPGAFVIFILRYHIKSLYRIPRDLSELFETLRYKLEGRGFDSRWGHWNFSLT